MDLVILKLTGVLRPDTLTLLDALVVEAWFNSTRLVTGNAYKLEKNNEGIGLPFGRRVRYTFEHNGVKMDVAFLRSELEEAVGVLYSSDRRPRRPD